MTVSDPSPMIASRTRMTVSSGWNSREVSLNGRLIGVTRLDAGQGGEAAHQLGLARADLADDGDDRPAPSRSGRTGSGPRPRMWLFTPMTSASVALAAITTNIASSFLGWRVARDNKKAEVVTSASPGTTRAPGS